MVCRLCLQISNEEDTILLFQDKTKVIDGISVVILIFKYLKMQLTHDDAISKCICLYCFHELEEFHTFWTYIDLTQSKMSKFLSGIAESVCRLCFKSLTHDKAISIFESGEEYVEGHLAKLIRRYFQIELKPDIIFRQICQNCNSHLEDFHNFHMRIDEAQRELPNEPQTIKIENDSDMNMDRIEYTDVIMECETEDFLLAPSMAYDIPNNSSDTSDDVYEDNSTLTLDSTNDAKDAAPQQSKTVVRFNYNDYVKYDKSTGFYICLIDSCKKKLRGCIGYNIRRHYKLIHKIVIRYLMERNEWEKIRKTIDGSEPAIKIDDAQNEIQRHNNVEHKTYNALGKNEFLKHCLGMVTVKNMPFTIFDDNEFFKKLIAPYEENFNTNLTSKIVIDTILKNGSQQIKEIITDSLNNYMISLKIDVISREERSIMTLNIQHIEDFQIYTKTIGIIKFTKQQLTEQHIKMEIRKCFKEFQIDMQQIYTVTIENVANVLNNANLPKEVQCESNLKQTAGFQQIKAELATIFPITFCASEALQLSAEDVLSMQADHLEKCRNTIQTLRTMPKIKKLNLLNADNPNRWCTTFDMLERLLMHKTIIEESASDTINWSFVENFVNAFKPLREYKRKVENEQYICGDFLRDWLACELDLEDLMETNSYAAALHKAMSIRKLQLFECEHFLAGLYLDPRFNFQNTPLLTEQQQQKAMQHLLKTYKMITQLDELLETACDGNDINTAIPSLSDDLPSTSKSAYYKLEKRIQQLVNNPSTEMVNQNIIHKLLALSEGKMESFNTNVLDWWKLHCQNNDELLQLVRVVLALPVTHVSVRRTFKALNTLPFKTRLKSNNELLSNIVLTKLDFELIKSQDIDWDIDDT